MQAYNRWRGERVRIFSQSNLARYGKSSNSDMLDGYASDSSDSHSELYPEFTNVPIGNNEQEAQTNRIEKGYETVAVNDDESKVEENNNGNVRSESLSNTPTSEEVISPKGQQKTMINDLSGVSDNDFIHVNAETCDGYNVVDSEKVANITEPGDITDSNSANSQENIPKFPLPYPCSSNKKELEI